MLAPVDIVLVEPSHPGNIGAAARAMKNMGFSSLSLVAPKQFPHQEATVRAAGADVVLANAVVVDCLATAIADHQLVFATSARSRRLPWPVCTPRQCAAEIAQATTRSAISVAIVFGRESSGLTNQELAMCHYHVSIPACGQFSSLNLAAAVQIILYELRLAMMGEEPTITAISERSDIERLATVEQTRGFLEQLESLLHDIDFLDSRRPKRLLQRLQRLFNRAQLREEEIDILRGIIATLKKRLLLL